MLSKVLKILLYLLETTSSNSLHTCTGENMTARQQDKDHIPTKHKAGLIWYKTVFAFRGTGTGKIHKASEIGHRTIADKTTYTLKIKVAKLELTIAANMTRFIFRLLNFFAIEIFDKLVALIYTMERMVFY